MQISKLFKSNKSQAVRLPKAVAFPEGVTEVEILVVGNSRLICPKGHRWDDFFDGVPKITGDFERGDQGKAESRLGIE